MKLPFDKNLSPRLRERAIAHGYAIVSKDNDFRQRAFLSARLPKVIWLAVGKAGTQQILE